MTAGCRSRADPLPARALWRMVGDRDVAGVKAVCEANPGVLKSRSGFLPLVEAARTGHCDMAAVLLDHGADVNAAPFYGPKSAHTNLERPLHWAVGFGHVEMVKMLLKPGADVNGCLTGMTPLLSAARSGNRAIYDLLLQHGATPNIFVFAATRTLAEMKRRLKADPSAVNSQDEYGTPPLFIAAEQWRPDMVELLLQCGADVGMADAHKDTVLHKVAIRLFDAVLWWGQLKNPVGDEQAQLATARLLVEHGADVNALNWRKITPLHRAVRANRIGYVRFLIEHGTAVDVRNMAGETPLRRAVSDPDRLEVARLLIDSGASVNSTDKKGRRLLCCARGRAMKELLVKSGANWNG
jgi:ankyrin repeat protein